MQGQVVGVDFLKIQIQQIISLVLVISADAPAAFVRLYLCRAAVRHNQQALLAAQRGFKPAFDVFNFAAVNKALNFKVDVVGFIDLAFVVVGQKTRLRNLNTAAVIYFLDVELNASEFS